MKKVKTIDWQKMGLIAERYIFPVILLLFSFVNVNKGIDITDVGYNLGNFTYLGNLDRMWYYSTLFSNYIGWVLVHLPFGATMLGVSIYLRIIRAAFVLWLYRFLVKTVKLNAVVSFFGLFLSLALCWAPAYGVYHYMTYYLFTVTTALLYVGLRDGKRKNLVLAGVVLALNVFVRFPNICEVALIVAVWWYSIAKREKFKNALNNTLNCIIGYVATLAVIFGIIAIKGNLGTYIGSIKELFSMTDESERYGIWFTIRNLIASYTCVWYWMIPVALGVAGLLAVGLIAFRKDSALAKLRPLYHIVAVLGFAVIYIWHYKKALFDYNFRSYSSMYLYSVVIIIVCLVLMLFASFSKAFEPSMKVLFVSAIVITLITPLGSNNSLYAAINNLFLLMPLSMYVAVSFWNNKKTEVMATGLVTLLAFYTVQMTVFGCMFTFREKQPAQDTRVTNNPVVAGMKTTKANAKLLEDISDIWDKESLKEARVLSFGEVPGIAYYMGSEPAISSTWPSLPSYSVEKFKNEMAGLEKQMKDEGVNVAVITDFNLDAEGEKQEILKKFLKDYNYKEVYSEQGYVLWISE